MNVTANGNINGLVISRQNTTINAAQSFSGTVLSGGTANLAAGGSISGTIVGVGGISASGTCFYIKDVASGPGTTYGSSTASPCPTPQAATVTAAHW